MLPDYAMSALCKFYCNGCFPLAPVVLPLCDFSPVCFATLVEEHNHPACALFEFGHLLFSACKAKCDPDVLDGGSMPFCVGPGGTLIDVAMLAGPEAFIIAFLICVPCRHDPAVHFCQLRVGYNPCQMFRWRAKCKQELGVNLTVASHQELVVITYEQGLVHCWGFDTVCAARVDAFLRHFDWDGNKDFMKNVALQSWLRLDSVGRRCL